LASGEADDQSALKRTGEVMDAIRPWITPRGGPTLWCTLPDGRNADDIARAALRQNVLLAPGNVFSISQSASGFMRFNVAQMADCRVFAVLEQALGEGV
jgi:DNA-binding transcriptional MocR family regulator